MDTDTITGSQPSEQDWLAQATSELNNLIQIIAGTSASLEDICQGNKDSQHYLMTLRATIERVEKLSASMVKKAGGPIDRSLTSDKFTSDSRPKSPQAGPKKTRILVVDDEQVTLGLVSRILSDADYEVTTAQSGFECLDHFRLQPFQFDLVLLDLTMPFMDGEETFHRLRELRPDISVVMCTGFIQHERLQRLMSEGLAGFLRKPVPPDEIVGYIHSTLAKIRYSCGQVDSSRIPVHL